MPRVDGADRDRPTREPLASGALPKVPHAPILPSVQILRGLTAAAVVFQHVIQQAGVFVGHPGEPAYAWLRPLPWEGSVDMFFVISGFVMVWSSVPLFGRPGAAQVFARRRVARVVPLYWIATALLLAATLVLPGAVSEPAPSLALVAASFLFLPWQRPDGLVQPVFRVGWTLNYEMMFYAVFAVFVRLRARLAVPCVVGVVCGLAGLGWLLRPQAAALAFWTDPMVMEFAAGAVLAAAAGRVHLPGTVRVGLMLMGLAGLKAAQMVPPWVPHGVAFGPPCVAMAAGVMLGRPRFRQPGDWPRSVRLLAGLGDVSYSLYLVHPFPMRALALLWPRLGAAGSMAGVLGYVAVAMVAAIAVAWGVHVWVEQPVTAVAQRLVRGRARA